MPASKSTGELLREWRARRRVSQHVLAREVGISTRRLCAWEANRTVPERANLLLLAERLGVPPRDRNVMLDSAGLLPAYPEHALTDPGFRVPLSSIGLALTRHAPNPAVAIDRHWTIVAANRGLAWLVAGVDPLLRAPPINLPRLCLHPAGLAPRIVNLPEWRGYLVDRLRRQSEFTGDAGQRALLDEIQAYPIPNAATGRSRRDQVSGLAVPLRLATVDGPLTFFSTSMVFAAPLDVTLSELAIEAWLPADQATATRMARAAEAQTETRAPITPPARRAANG